MEQQILDLIKKETDTFFIAPTENGKSIIMLVFGYAPFYMQNKEDTAQIDAYYLISNSSYHRAKELAKRLSELGLRANYRFDFNYKKFVLDNGFVGVGKNTLTYIKGLGSRFVMQAIEVEGSFNYSKPDTVVNLNCANCNLCKNACPTGAISDDGFDPNKCLRHHQESEVYVSDEIAKSMQNRLLGCDICQAVCPFNKAQKSVEMPQNLKANLQYDVLFETLESEQKTREIFVPLIGKNYAKVKKILPQTILVAGNSGNKNLVLKLKKFSKSDDNLVSENLKRALKNLV
ncbi:MAG: epoxyqueuosine reductase [Spirochaetales bacterium]